MNPINPTGVAGVAAPGPTSIPKIIKKPFLNKGPGMSARIISLLILAIYITSVVLFYYYDPLSIISNNLGYSIFTTILLSSFVALIALDLFFDKSYYNVSTMFSAVNVYSFYITLALILAVYFIYKFVPMPSFITNIFSNTSTFSFVLFIIFLIIILALVNRTVAFFLRQIFTKIFEEKTSYNVMIIKNSIFFLLGLALSGYIIYQLVTYTGDLTNSSNILYYVLNILIVTTILAILYKAILPFILKFVDKYPLLGLIYYSILYIPCLLSNLVDYIYSSSVKTDVKGKVDIGTKYLPLMILLIILIITYYLVPYLYPIVDKYIISTYGNQLIPAPLGLYNLQTVSTYHDLNNDIDSFTYKYGLSFWFMINDFSPSGNVSNNQFTSILNYGEKPNILYNASKNILKITENGETMYETNKLLLQKWNYIVINYDSGTLDIFLNNELLKSKPNVVPYMTYDALTAGSDNGINGEICNLIYSKIPLTKLQIFNLYNRDKNKNPPV